jgi:hypothetical protein
VTLRQAQDGGARIQPSILAADFVNLEAEVARIATADAVHVDVMDNHFVPNLTFGPQMVGRLQAVAPIPLDVHLMISDVDRWAPDGCVRSVRGPASPSNRARRSTPTWSCCRSSTRFS